MFKITKRHNNATLHQQNMGIYKAGRWFAISILIIGTILSLFFISTWVSNVIQGLIVFLFDSQNGLFSFDFSNAISHLLKNIITPDAFIHDQFALSQLHFLGITWFLYHGRIIGSILKFVVAIACEFITFKLFSDVWVKYRKINHHEHGNGKFESPENIAKETIAIPDREFSFDNPAGAIMMHKFNTRGVINHIVKQQLGMIKSTLKLDKGHDPTGANLRHFFMWFKVVVATTIIVIVSSALFGGVKYNTASSSSSNPPWYSPFYFFLFLWKLLHFIGLGIIELIEEFFSMNTSLFSLPLYISYVIGMVELALVGIYVYHILEKVHISAKYDTIHTYLHKFTKDGKEERHKNKVKHQKIRAQEKQHTIWRWHEFEHPLDKEFKPELDQEIRYHTKPKSNFRDLCLRKPRIYLAYKWINKKLHARHPFWSHPVLALKMIVLQACADHIPLDEGITGWYYLTSGNGALQNILLYGITRSGKGQMIINTITDINSRATHPYQKNMIFNDSKGELAASTFRILKKRGYDVKVLNIMNMSHSMSYNPLEMVIRQARAGAVGSAAKSCSQLSFTIYNPAGQGQNSFFYTEAASLFDSIAFALIAFAHARYYGMNDYKTDRVGKDKNGKKLGTNVRDDGKARNKPKNDGKYYKDKNGHVHSSINAWSRVTINNVLQMTVQLGGEEAQVGNDEMNQSNELMIYFEHLQDKLNDLRSKESKDTDETMKDHIAILSQAVSEFQNSKMAGSKTAGSIYSTFLDRLRIYQQPDVAKMTSMNSYDAEEMGFDRLFTIQFSRQFSLQAIHVALYGSTENNQGQLVPNLKERPIESEDTYLNEIGIAKIPFSKAIKYNTFFIVMRIHDERTGQNGKDFKFIIKCHKHFYQPKEYYQMRGDYHEAPRVADLKVTDDKKYHKDGKKHPIVIDKYTQQEKLKGIKLTVYKEPDRSEYAGLKGGINKLAKRGVQVVRQLHFLYNPRPTALFLVTPPNEPELNQLCTFVINQTFNMLSSYSLKIAKGRHVQRSLQFILDELGNIPAIPNMSTKVSIGLSQHIEFLLVFQNYEQAVHNYHKDAQSILSNCSTVYFILSKSSQTIQSISKACGNRTIYNRGRNADPTKVANANYNASTIAQPVITQDQLRQLKPGDLIIIRANDRSTKWGKSTIPYPIFDTGRYQLPYSYSFLGKFESKDSLNSLPVVTPHKYLDLESVTLHFNAIYDWMEDIKALDQKHAQKKATDIRQKIDASNMPQTFKNMYNVMLNEAMAKSKQAGNATPLNRQIDNINDWMKFNNKLFKFRDVAEVSQYILTVIANDPKRIQTLMDAPVKQHGNNIFDLIADEKSYLVQSYDAMRTRMESQLDEKNVKAIAPYLYASKQGQIMYGIANIIAHYQPSQPNRKTQAENSSQNEGWVLYELNKATNQYLASLGILKINGDKVQLTTKGQSLIKNRQTEFDKFFKDNKFDYQPNTPLSTLFNQLMDNLVWVSKHPVYTKYYGIAWVLGVVDLKKYKEFDTYKAPKIDTYGDPVKDANGQVQYHNVNIGTTPMTYNIALLVILDMFIHHPNYSQDNQQDHISKQCSDYTKKLNKIDHFAGSLFED